MGLKKKATKITLNTDIPYGISIARKYGISKLDFTLHLLAELNAETTVTRHQTHLVIY